MGSISNISFRLLLGNAIALLLTGASGADSRSERVSLPPGAAASAVAEALRAPGTRGLRVANPEEIVAAHLPALLEEAGTDAHGHRLAALNALRVLGKALREEDAFLPQEVEAPMLGILRTEERALCLSHAAETLRYVRPLSEATVQYLVGIARGVEFHPVQNGAWAAIASLAAEFGIAKQAVLEALQQGGEGLGLVDRITHYDPEILAAAVAAFQRVGGGDMPGCAYLKRFEARIPERTALFESVSSTILDPSLDGVRRDMAFGNLLAFKSLEAHTAVERVIPVLLAERDAPRDLLRAAIRVTAHAGNRIPNREALLRAIAEGGDADLANEAAHALRGQVSTPARRR